MACTRAISSTTARRLALRVGEDQIRLVAAAARRVLVVRNQAERATRRLDDQREQLRLERGRIDTGPRALGQCTRLRGQPTVRPRAQPGGTLVNAREPAAIRREIALDRPPEHPAKMVSQRAAFNPAPGSHGRGARP